MLSDGTYDVVVVDAEAGDDGALHLEVTILAGEHKGDLVSVAASGLDRDPLDLLAAPGTLTVADGAPSLVLEG